LSSLCRRGDSGKNEKIIDECPRTEGWRKYVKFMAIKRTNLILCLKLKLSCFPKTTKESKLLE
jgi:hypothetical protein